MGVFEALPDDILIAILVRTDAQTLDTAANVNRQWRAIACDDASWRRAIMHSYGYPPFQRLDAARMPTDKKQVRGWISEAQNIMSWRSELFNRQNLQKIWTKGTHRRHEYSPRVGVIETLVVCEQHGWALAVSAASGAAVKSMPMTGKVLARDNDTSHMLFATQAGEEASAVAARLDRIVWGLPDGRSVVTLLTRDGVQRQRVESQGLADQSITAVAGAYDALAQEKLDWGKLHGVNPKDYIASAGDRGSVLVWDTSGSTQRELKTIQQAALTHVAWADSQRYVAATGNGMLFVWDLQSDSSKPATELPLENIRVVMLAGDPFGPSFIVATEAGAVRVDPAGSVMTRFSTDAVLTAAMWRVETRNINTRVLILGDAGGNIRVYNSDNGRLLVQRDRVHVRAIAAVAVNAALVVAASRDGSIAILDVLSGTKLSRARCRNWRSRGQFGQWMWSLHPELRTTAAMARFSALSRLIDYSSSDWSRQVVDRVDTLGRPTNNRPPHISADDFPNRRFPSTVSHISAGYAWIAVATGTHIYACFTQQPAPPPLPHARVSRVVRSRSSIREVLAEGLEEMKIESEQARNMRLQEQAKREHIEREFVEPEDKLGLNPEEQLAYALWLSSNDAPVESMSEEEQIAHAINLSRLSS
ncbi:hypothetical protein EV183_003948 [Coemansia sp. RSA 2336]|nr:hypothetical protein EV183_003948 [Coemansia sp. RSA 2336]